MTQLWLALDLGTTGIKAALIQKNGQTVRSAYRDYPTFTGENGIVEQDANTWWTAVVEAVRELRASEATAIAVTGQMQNIILIDSAGNPLRPVILYSDTRAHHEATEVNGLIGASKLRQITGNEQDAGSVLAKLVWLSRNESESLSRSSYLLLGAADFITYKLTGNAVTDSTTASTTGLLDIGTRRLISPDVFAKLGLREAARLVPQALAGGSAAGIVSENAAKSLGIRGGLPVHQGPGDAGATTLGVGSGEVGQPYGYIGTSGWVGYTALDRARPETGVFTLAHPQPDRYFCVAPILTAGGNLEWVRDLFGVDDHDALIDAALSQEPSGLIYLPYLNGERAPFSDPFARGAFIGLSTRHGAADLCRAVLEGVAYSYRHALDALISEPIKTLTLTGGGTQSRAWCQLIADVIGIPVAITDDPTNVGVRGAVLAGLIASREHRTYTPKDFFPVATTLQPNRQYSAYFDRQYRLFRDSYLALKPTFAAMAT